MPAFRNDRFDELRERDGVTQEDVANKVGVSKKQVNQWVSGQAEPRTDNLVALAQMFDISLDYLLGLSDVERSYLTPADLLKDEAKLIGAYRRGNSETLFKLLTEKLRKDIGPQIVIPRRKPKARK